MIDRKEIQEIVSEYHYTPINGVSIGVIGSHSAEEVGIAGRAFGFPVVAVCQKGRDELYAKYNKDLFRHIITLDDFSDIIEEKNQENLRDLKTVFIPNRSFSSYVSYDDIENNFRVPLYGSRSMLRIEDRNTEKNQYWLLEKAGVKTPKRIESPKEIDRLAIVKVPQKKRPKERAFFYPNSYEDYKEKSCLMIRQGVIDKVELEKARIEEFVLGPRYNANFQSWSLKNVFDNFDFVGFDDREQTNLGGVLNLPAKEQLKLDVIIKNEEVGHQGKTMRESLKPLVYEAAEKFIKASQENFSPGMIGLFSLQGALAYDTDDPEQKKIGFYVFDVSPRIPGCPCVGPTSPEMRRLTLKYPDVWKYSPMANRVTRIETPMDLCMLEIRYSEEHNKIKEIVT